MPHGKKIVQRYGQSVALHVRVHTSDKREVHEVSLRETVLISHV